MRKGCEEASGVMSVFTILSGMMISQVYPYVKTYSIIHFRYQYLQLIMWQLYFKEAVKKRKNRSGNEKLTFKQNSGVARILVAFLLAQSVKYLPAMQETRVRFLGWEDPLEKEMATYSSIFAWRILWTEILEGYSPWGHKSRTRLMDWTTTSSSKVISYMDIWGKNILGKETSKWKTLNQGYA